MFIPHLIRTAIYKQHGNSIYITLVKLPVVVIVEVDVKERYSREYCNGYEHLNK